MHIRMPATTVEMWQPKHGHWVTLHRTRDGFWTFPSSGGVDKPIVLPFKVRLTAPNGESLTDIVNPPSMGKYISCIHDYNRICKSKIENKRPIKCYSKTLYISCSVVVYFLLLFFLTSGQPCSGVDILFSVLKYPL